MMETRFHNDSVRGVFFHLLVKMKWDFSFYQCCLTNDQTKMIIYE